MHMGHGLPRTRPVVESDVVRIRRKLLVQQVFGHIKQTHHGNPLRGTEMEERPDVAFRQNQRVSR